MLLIRHFTYLLKKNNKIEKNLIIPPFKKQVNVYYYWHVLNTSTPSKYAEYLYIKCEHRHLLSKAFGRRMNA